MKNIIETKNKAFQFGKQNSGSTLSASYIPLFIDARGPEKASKNSKNQSQWIERKLCLFHGYGFHWKRGCPRCRYLISFSEYLEGGS
jgi:hypothetical protein